MAHHPRKAATLLAGALAAALAAPGARATGSLWIDAGDSARVSVDAPIALQAHVEGATAPSIAWTAEPGCTVTPPDSLFATGECSDPGVKTFTATVIDGNDSASDDVRMVVVREIVEEVARATGTTQRPGIPDELVNRSGELDGANQDVPFIVEPGTVRLDATLSWQVAANDLDFAFRSTAGTLSIGQGNTLSMPETIVTYTPEPGQWAAVVQPRAAAPLVQWEAVVVATLLFGETPMPRLTVPKSERSSTGETVTLVAEAAGGTGSHDLSWELDPASYRFDDGSGGSFSFVFSADTTVKVKVTDANGLEAVAHVFVRGPGNPELPFTVVAVVDTAYSPYHYDFLGHQHPFNTDDDPANDFDFGAHPSTYIAGYPGDAEAINLTIPQSELDEVEGTWWTTDAAETSTFRSSTASDVNLFWFPDTKVIGGVSFDPGGTWYGTNSEHGTRSAASAAGNIHGSCPECLFVLIQGFSAESLRWAATQPWIDVVNNSYGHNTTGVIRDGVYTGAPVAATRAASEDGQTIVFSAGNGLGNAFDVPQHTYTSSEQGPDWTITVGAVNPTDEHGYLGSGKPADISSIGSGYPSTGGTTAGGTGTHSGTSNAGPVAVGTFGKVLQEARSALGDTVNDGHTAGVVAEGTPVGCGPALPACPLGDGVLTRRELQDLVFENVLPRPGIGGTSLPSTGLDYYYIGHGVLSGRIRGDEAWNDEWGRMVGVAVGVEAPLERPAGEKNWFVVDSACRQRLWGDWSGGYFTTGQQVTLDPAADPIASAYYAWCAS